MMKRGISPLIGWVVLVGFSVAAGLLVTQWAVQQFNDIDLPEDKEGYCNDMELKVVGNCINFDGNTVSLTIENQGAFTVKRITFGREATGLAEGWCLDLLNERSIAPGPDNKKTLSYWITAPVDQTYYTHDSTTTFSCADIGEVGDTITSADINSLELVPWIEVEGDAFFCYDKRINLNSETGINECLP
jgi:hypothetical protein